MLFKPKPDHLRADARKKLEMPTEEAETVVDIPAKDVEMVEEASAPDATVDAPIKKPTVKPKKAATKKE